MQQERRQKRARLLRTSSVSMKFIYGILIGAVITAAAIEVRNFTTPSERDSAILINIINDTQNIVSLVELESDDGQIFSCSLIYNKCSIGLLNIGDSSFSIKAILNTGAVLHNGIGYTEPGKTHNLVISDFEDENT